MKDYTFEFDAMFHVFIVFIFLNSFFWLYASNIEKHVLSNEINKVVYSIPEIMDYIKKIDVNNNIDYNLLKPKLEKIISENSTENKKMVQNNNKIFIISMIMIVTLLILITGFIYYVKSSNNTINYISVLKDNAFSIVFIGIIEYLFFTYIVSKYIPVMPTFMIDTLISRIKKRYSEQDIE